MVGTPVVGRQGEGPLQDVPYLHGAILQVDAERVRRLVERLARAAADSAEGEARDEAASVDRATRSGDLDVPRLLAGSVALDDEAVGALAGELGLDETILALIGQLASLLLLLGIGRATVAELGVSAWSSGYCPVCAAWPVLVELRGLEQRRCLRCGRCGADWAMLGPGCVVCPPDHQARQTYLAPEASREARRAATCGRCRSYVKEIATIQPIPDAELGLLDLETIELDLAAAEHGFARPAGRAFPLAVVVEAVERRRGVWTPWRR